MDQNPSPALPRAELRETSATVRYMLAGNAHVTFQSEKTGVHLTYHVVKADPKPGDTRTPPWFVSVLTAPDHYEYLGAIFTGDHGQLYFTHTRASRISVDAKSHRAFKWVWSKLSSGHMPTTLSVYHEGRCGRCGRRLTTPESIQTGLGPECAKKSEGGSR